MNESTNSTTYRVIVLESGEQVPVSSAPGVEMRLIVPGDPIKDEIHLDLTDAEFKKIQEQAATNDIPEEVLKIN